MGKNKTIHDAVYGFKTKYEDGFIDTEILTLLKDYPNINKDKFYDALSYITCTMKEGNIVIYRSDVELALRCGLENRDQTPFEFD